MVEIPLDPLKTPQQNAARYYKNYTKAKTAETMLTLQLEKGAQEAAYLDSVLDSVSQAEGTETWRKSARSWWRPATSAAGPRPGPDEAARRKSP
ncbi:MAG: NFACT family protein [Evtepia gabavorous]